MARRHKKHAAHAEEHENEERWLLTYSDMITLLLALFIVLWSISSVNTSKFNELSKSLAESFSGPVLPGGSGITKDGGSAKSTTSTPGDPVQAIMPSAAVKAAVQSDLESEAGSTKTPSTPKDVQSAAAVAAQKAQEEQEGFKELKRKIDAEAQKLGLGKQVKTVIRPDGLVVQLLTDGVFYDSGSAALKPASFTLLDDVAKLVGTEGKHPVEVTGYTDSQPISRGYSSNWSLSVVRAAHVVERMTRAGVPGGRMVPRGLADQHPVASNSTAAGRARNRRVEVVLTRIYNNPGSTVGTPSGGATE